MSTRMLGQQFEKMSCDYLTLNHNMRLRQANYQTAAGEIDLIMEDHSSEDALLAFVEVRYRQAGDAAISVNRHKQRRIIKVATQYLLSQQLYDKIVCRFDIVAVHGTADHAQFEWLPDAFRQ